VKFFKKPVLKLQIYGKIDASREALILTEWRIANKMAKWVYLFEEGNADMRNLLGGKGANLAEMTNLGLPIPTKLHKVLEQLHDRAEKEDEKDGEE
jgi:hypothetical protein